MHNVHCAVKYSTVTNNFLSLNLTILNLDHHPDKSDSYSTAFEEKQKYKKLDVWLKAKKRVDYIWVQKIFKNSRGYATLNIASVLGQ